MENGVKGSLKALENWAKMVTRGYKDVDVRDMSTSFRNGLAFCAIIHHFRPDLIDFDSLSRGNIYENNSLAFSTAEKQLGVPALLDAEDMEKYSVPDRLSIITYLAQLHNCFENQNKVNKMRASFKRSKKEEPSGPPAKISIPDVKLQPIKRHEVCTTCRNRVFLLERLIVDGKLYHRTCFCCKKCNHLLNPGAYVESDTPGFYECTVCPNEEELSPPPTPHEASPAVTPSSKPQNRLAFQYEVPIKQSPLSASVTSARNSFLQQSLKKSSEAKVADLKESSALKSNEADTNGDLPSHNQGTVRDKIHAFELNSSSSSEASPVVPKSVKILNHNRHSSLTLKSEEKGNLTEMSDSKFSSKKSPEVVNNTEPIKTSRSDTQCSTSEEVGLNDNSVTSATGAIATSSIAKVPSFNAKTPLHNGSRYHSLYRRQESDISEMAANRNERKPYTSVFSKDIFQTNLTPLKLGKSSLSSVPMRGSSSCGATPEITSPDSASRLSSFDIPLVKSTYSKTLPRPSSFASLPVTPVTRQMSESNSESDLNHVMHNRWSKSVLRRSSLESGNEVSSAEKLEAEKEPTPLPRKKTGDSIATPVKSNQFDSISSSLVETDVDSGRVINANDEKRESITIHPDNESDNSISSVTKPDVAPIPKARKSLESKQVTSTSMDKESDQSEQKLVIKNTEIDSAKENSSAIEKSQTPKLDIPKIQVEEEKSEKVYPEDLNPFGDDEEQNAEEYPDDLNPFGDDDDTGVADVTKSTPNTSFISDDYDESKNPFASDDDDEKPADEWSRKISTPLSHNHQSPFYDHSPSYSCSSSPTSSLRGTTKKRQAPKPPKLSEIFPNGSSNSLNVSPNVSRKQLQTPSPKLRKNKPAPPPPPPPPLLKKSSDDPAANSKQIKDQDNMKLKSTGETSSSKGSPDKQWKKKKRPAPPVPIPPQRHSKKIPIKEILREMKEIEEKQKEYEKRGKELELLIRDHEKDEEPTVEEEEYIMELFELVNKKNALFRRQAELMYIKRSQRLEEQQYDLENKIRILMSKPASQKTEEDKMLEDDLMLQFLDVVDQRNSIIDSIEMDRRRELEEDHSVREQLEIKNGELPITAEIKEKSNAKAKKKNKKDKKKKHEENGAESSGKGTLKRKKWLSKLPT